MYGLSLPENYSESNALNNLMVLHIHTDETDSLSKFSCKLIVGSREGRLRSFLTNSMLQIAPDWI